MRALAQRSSEAAGQINTIALMVLYGLLLGTEIFFEAAMIIAMLGFVSTVAYARFMLRGNIIE